MNFRLLVLMILWLCICDSAQAQLIFPESFNVIFDTSKTVKGSIQPDLKFRTLKENLFSLELASDMTIRLKENAFTGACKLEYTRLGKNNILSGGFAYGEYRRITDSKYVSEFSAQIQWAEARGLELRYAAAYHARFRLIYEEKGGVFIGLGPLIEIEKWGYQGVPEGTSIPTNPESIEISRLRASSYIAAKWSLDDRLSVNSSVYYQAPLDFITKGRFGSSTSLQYALVKHIKLVVLYQNIFDSRPIVPIRPWFNRIDFGVSVNF